MTRFTTLLATLMILAPAAGNLAARAADAPVPGPPNPFHAHHRPQARGLLGTLPQLGLSADQAAQVRSILQSARTQGRGRAAAPPADHLALANPGDPNHALALQAAQARVVARLNRWDAIQQQVYEVLTPAQKAQVPALLALQQQQRQQRSERWRAGHTGEAG
jgi:Spy/CpxP family protein refolding chaperone